MRLMLVGALTALMVTTANAAGHCLRQCLRLRTLTVLTT